MAKLDREQQFDILQSLAATYPHAAIIPFDEQTDAFIANLHYLMEHGLIEAEFKRDQSAPTPDPSGHPRDPRYVARNIRIAARGMDVLAADGGLSALQAIANQRRDERQ